MIFLAQGVLIGIKPDVRGDANNKCVRYTATGDLWREEMGPSTGVQQLR